MGEKKVQKSKLEKKTHDMLKEFEEEKVSGLLGALIKSKDKKEK